MKCLVHGCANHKQEGVFVGDLCQPCYTMLATGKVMPSDAWFVRDLAAANAEREELEEAAKSDRWVVEEAYQNEKKAKSALAECMAHAETIANAAVFEYEELAFAVAAFRAWRAKQ